MTLVYSATAIADLTRLRVFIAKHDPSAARRIASELVDRIEALRQFPRMGSPVDAAPDPDAFRDLVIGSYILRYALHADVIAVLRVWHHFEDRH